jgi:hypothetical protein
MRVSRKQPWFSGVVIGSLALGLAAALTVVNVSYNVLFAPLALPRPNELVTAMRWTNEGRDNVFTWSEVQVLRAAPGATIAAMRGASSVAFRVGDRRAPSHCSAPTAWGATVAAFHTDAATIG